jgi:simple sugar transport system substrate-binding protein
MIRGQVDRLLVQHPRRHLDPTEDQQHFNGARRSCPASTRRKPSSWRQRAAGGDQVWAIPYDFKGACDIAPDVCLGVPYFHWGPAYVEIVNAVKDGNWKQSWDWKGPDWEDINDVDTSTVGFVEGTALNDADKESLDAFIAELAAYASDPANDGTFFLWEGPLAYQDGTELAAEGEKVPAIAKLGEKPSVWYLDQLLEGMTGASS